GGGRPGRPADLRRHTGAVPLHHGRGGVLRRREVIRGSSRGGWGSRAGDAVQAGGDDAAGGTDGAGGVVAAGGPDGAGEGLRAGAVGVLRRREEVAPLRRHRVGVRPLPAGESRPPLVVRLRRPPALAQQEAVLVAGQGTGVVIGAPARARQQVVAFLRGAFGA